MAPDSSNPVIRLTGKEPFSHDDVQLGRTVDDFWSWSSSDLLSNALRGMLAEYIVGVALGCVDHRIRLEWDAFDLKTDDGTTIEVKSTAYLQSWGVTKPSSRRFSIGETTAWHADTNTYETTAMRQADVYVFCVHTADDRAVADPLRLEQWEFYVVATATINRRLGNQRSIALSRLPRALDVSPVRFDGIADAVRQAVRP
ncbi:hypothetical protein V1Y59_18345 [Gordonia sp. PKS22-38]|uniref:Restriction endonuclease n=1 Tax=Gordonia prachuapensis TaxID=3115651 RepID=A0ABU7MXJ4_9ACTN|nr:hypothetical protein [Gordonia sp. PKS22-38]